MGRASRLLAALVALLLLGPIRAADESAICTDRPAKASGACTVEPGRFQYETDLVDYTHARVHGTTTDVWLATSPTLRVGAIRDLEWQAAVTPWVVVRTTDADGNRSTLRGPGDLFLRLKWRVPGDGDAPLSAALFPYVKAPTARRGIGNGAVESGLLVPIVYGMTDRVSVTTVPEFDSLKDADRRGHHAATSQLVNVAYAWPNGVTLSGEFWGNWNRDPSGTQRQCSADAALSWALRKTVQVDVGVNAGLNRDTPRIQAYVGLSRKF